MTSTNRRVFLKNTLAGAGAIGLAGTGLFASAKELQKMAYGGSPWLSHYPTYLAIENGLLKKEGIDLRWESFVTGSARLSAMMAGDVDLAGFGSISTMALMARGVKQFYVVGVPENFGKVEGLFVKEGINSIADLKGKTIGTAFASSTHLLVLDLIASSGLTPDKDINVINISGPEIIAAMKSGQIDACAAWTPQFNILSSMPGVKLLADDTSFSLYKEFGTTPGPDLLVVKKSYAESNPEAVKSFIKAYFQSCEVLKNTPEKAVPILKKLTNLSDAEQLQTIQGAEWYTLEQQKDLMAKDGKFVTGLQKLAEMLVTYKQLDSAPKVSDWINPNFI